MMGIDKTTEVFYALVHAGLWGRVEGHSPNPDDVDWDCLCRIAEEQTVAGLITAGLDNATVIKAPQNLALHLIGASLQLEQQNLAMNKFIANLVGEIRKAGIYTLLVKGQGLAQSYEKPLWRACGDVDLLLSDDNYQKAKDFLLPKATSVEIEDAHKRHLGMTIDGWVVELHGSLRCGFSSRVDKALDGIYHDTFYNGNVTSWNNNGVQVFMLGKENDVLYVFAHFLNHFYKGGLGLRQICDWARLLWNYREKLNMMILESKIRQMGVLSEWKAFGAFAVEYLGMPVEAMLLYSDASKWKRKARQINDFILMSGNFGHNRDMSYYRKYPYAIRKCISMGQRIGDLCRHARIFPLDSLRFSFTIMKNGLRSAVRGE